MPRTTGTAFLLGLLLGVAAAACDSDAEVGTARCEELQQRLTELVTNPPTRWNKEAYDLQQEMEALGCEPQLGEVPFQCNAGAPQCPDGYSCVDQEGLRVCKRS